MFIELIELINLLVLLFNFVWFLVSLIINLFFFVELMCNVLIVFFKMIVNW